MFPAGPLRIPQLTRPPELVWQVPGSKSITNRALVLAALAEGESTLEGVLHSDDTRHMRSALTALGITIEDHGPTTLRVRGGRGQLRAPKEPLFVGNSGTTVRFLAGLCCLVPGPVTLVGDEVLADGPVTVDISGNLVSRPYIDITRRMIEDFGGSVDVTPKGYRVPSRAAY